MTTLIMPEFLDYESWLNDPAVLETASRIANNPHPDDKRSWEERYYHTRHGYAAEREAFRQIEKSLSSGWRIEMPRAKWYDFKIIDHNEKESFIDIKLMISGLGKTHTIRKWEAENALNDTIYPIYKKGPGNSCIFFGWARKSAYVPSHNKKGTDDTDGSIYIRLDRLNKSRIIT